VPLRLVLEISDDDLEYFRKVMEATWQGNCRRDEKDLLEGARGLLEQAGTKEMPEYVRKRMDDLGSLISMLEDPEWPLEAGDRTRVLTALSYFADPQDMIPDSIPGLGFLDDALMAELVIRELKHELDAYRDFSDYRKNQLRVRGKEGHVGREDWLAQKRRQLFYRMKRRREERHRHYSTAGPTLPILRYQG
jgi:uncharacterized membrane protein YkvA (DUF1232 family)